MRGNEKHLEKQQEKKQEKKKQAINFHATGGERVNLQEKSRQEKQQPRDKA